MDRRFLNCLAIFLMTAGVAVAAPYGQSARPATYQAQEEVDTPNPADDDGGGDAGQGEMYDGCDDGCACQGGCGNGCCDLANPFSDCCLPIHGFWASGEYLGWSFKGQKLPVLVTSSPAGTAQSGAGLGSTATVVIGNSSVNNDWRSGARINAGYWYDDCQSIGWQGNVFGFGDSSSSVTASGDGTAGSVILARPFFNPVATVTPITGTTAFTVMGAPASTLINFPSVVSGNINVATTSQVMGAELNIRKMLQNNCCYRLDLIGGYRYFYLNESLHINESVTSINEPGVEAGSTINSIDHFGARNTFNGGQMGMQLNYTHCRWSFDVLGKMALGNMDQVVNIGGTTTTTTPNPPATATNPGGFLALGSNSGTFERNRVSAIPELNLTLGYQLNSCWRANVGYTFMYVTNVVRPAEQTDSFINPVEFPPSAGGGGSPRFVFRDNDMWIQGINAGLECRF